jgi:ADP-heptose:LPS heptosyltransferase
VVLGVDVRNKYKGVKGMLKLAKKLRKDYKIDAVADLHSVIRSWVIDSFMKSHGVRLARIDKGHKMKKKIYISFQNYALYPA